MCVLGLIIAFILGGMFGIMVCTIMVASGKYNDLIEEERKTNEQRKQSNSGK